MTYLNFYYYSRDEAVLRPHKNAVLPVAKTEALLQAFSEIGSDYGIQCTSFSDSDIRVLVRFGGEAERFRLAYAFVALVNVCLLDMQPVSPASSAFRKNTARYASAYRLRHPDADDIGGMRSVFQYAGVKLAGISERLVALLEAKPETARETPATAEAEASLETEAAAALELGTETTRAQLAAEAARAAKAERESALEDALETTRAQLASDVAEAKAALETTRAQLAAEVIEVKAALETTRAQLAAEAARAAKAEREKAKAESALETEAARAAEAERVLETTTAQLAAEAARAATAEREKANAESALETEAARAAEAGRELDATRVRLQQAVAKQSVLGQERETLVKTFEEKWAEICAVLQQTRQRLREQKEVNRRLKPVIAASAATSAFSPSPTSFEKWAYA